MGLTLRRGVDLPGRAWQEGRPVWVADLGCGPPEHRVSTSHCGIRWSRDGPCRFGSATRCSPCWSSTATCACAKIRKPLAAIETVAASLGQMLARSRERGRAEELTRQQEILLDSVADGICGIDRNGMVSFANPAAGAAAGRARTAPHRQARA